MTDYCEQQMNHWLGKCLCLLAALAVSDVQLVLVQTWAWGSMLHDRAPERGVVEAVESTFSGEEPCLMCSAIQEEQHQEQEESPIPESNPTLKWIPTVSSRVKLIFPVGLFDKISPEARAIVFSRQDVPETPPPDFLG